MRFHHIGVACRDIASGIQSIKKYYTITKISDTIHDPLQNAYLCILQTNQGPIVELISGEVVNNIISKGITYYHMCYEVVNISSTIETLTQKGAHLISPPKPAPLFNNRLVAFLHIEIGIIELLETEQ